MRYKILDYPIIFFIGGIVGTLIGMSLSYALLSQEIKNQEESYNLGYKTAQKECVLLIKNTK